MLARSLSLSLAFFSLWPSVAGICNNMLNDKLHFGCSRVFILPGALRGSTWPWCMGVTLQGCAPPSAEEEKERERCANLMLQPRVLINLEECLRHRRMQFIYLCAWRARGGSDIRKKLFCYRAGDELRARSEAFVIISGIAAENALCSSASLTMRAIYPHFSPAPDWTRRRWAGPRNLWAAGRCSSHQY